MENVDSLENVIGVSSLADIANVGNTDLQFNFDDEVGGGIAYVGKLSADACVKTASSIELSVRQKTNIEMIDCADQELVRASVRARENAYCPYSHFKVGAAVRDCAGTVYTGCNVENSAYPDSLCAERNAIAKAVSEGNQKFTALAIAGVLEPNSRFVFPCGSCRQVISEFSQENDLPIYLVKPDLKNVFVSSIRQLLPHGFNM